MGPIMLVGGRIAVSGVTLSQIATIAFAGAALFAVLGMPGQVPQRAGSDTYLVIYAGFLVWALAMAVADGTTIFGIQNIVVFVAGFLTLLYARLQPVPVELGRTAAKCGCVIAADYLLGSVVHAAPPPRGVALALLALLPIVRASPLSVRTKVVLTIVFVGTIGISLSRTALLAATLFVFATLPGRARAVRMLRLALGAVLIVLVIANVPALRNRFTGGDRAVSLYGITLNTEGRTVLWRNELQTYRQHELIGSGPGAARAAVEVAVGKAQETHNDYFRLLADYGLVGTGLYLAFLIAMWRRLRRHRLNGAQHAWVATWGLVVYLVSMVTDNPLDYLFVAIPLFAFIGATLGTPPTAAAAADESPAADSLRGRPTRPTSREPVTAGRAMPR